MQSSGIQPPNGLSLAEKLVWIDAEEAKLTQTIAQLRELRNTLNPIHSLPDDILTLVFIELSRNTGWTTRQKRVGESPDASTISVNTWLSVLSTCRRWRHIALATPMLWRRIDFGEDNIKLQRSRYFMKLSAKSTLALSMHRERLRTMTEIMDLIVPQMHRVTDFQFSLKSQRMEDTILRLDAPAPSLRVLCLRQDGGRRFLERHDALVARNLFGGVAPLLEHVTLKHVSLPWTTSLFRGLTSLDLASGHPSITPTMDQFLDVLEACPSMLSLRIVDAGPTLSSHKSTHPKPTRTVVMKALRNLTLSARCVDVAYMSAHLAIPSDTILRLSSDIEWSTQNFSHLLPRDISKLAPLVAMQAAKYVCEDEMFVSLSSIPGTGVDITLDLWYSGSDPEEPGRGGSAFTKLTSALKCLPHINRLEVQETDGTTVEQWTQVLSSIPALLELSLLSTSAEHTLAPVWTALCSPITNDGNINELPCPNLERLVIYALDMEGAKNEVAELVDALKVRKREGVPIRELYLRAPRGLTNAAVHHLQEHVGVTYSLEDPPDAAFRED